MEIYGERIAETIERECEVFARVMAWVISRGDVCDGFLVDANGLGAKVRLQCIQHCSIEVYLTIGNFLCSRSFSPRSLLCGCHCGAGY